MPLAGVPRTARTRQSASSSEGEQGPASGACMVVVGQGGWRRTGSPVNALVLDFLGEVEPSFL